VPVSATHGQCPELCDVSRFDLSGLYLAHAKRRYYAATAAFSTTSGSMSNLVNQIKGMKNQCKDTSVLGSFSENHDQPRFASLTNDVSMAKNIIAYTIMADGFPIMYQGQEQHFSGATDPFNREAVWKSGYNTSTPLYTLTAKANEIRNHALFQDINWLTYQNSVIYSDSANVAMRKGNAGYQTVTVLTNSGASSADYTLSVTNTGYTNGTEVVDILSCKGLTVGASGLLTVPMTQGLPRIFYPVKLLNCSDICGY
jgi:alpha-amylase